MELTQIGMMKHFVLKREARNLKTSQKLICKIRIAILAGSLGSLGKEIKFCGNPLLKHIVKQSITRAIFFFKVRSVAKLEPQ